MTAGELLKSLKLAFKAAGIESSRIDSELIVMEALGFTRVQLITREEYELSSDEIKKALEMKERRLKFEPMQYILGSCEFMGMNFSLNCDTLIPRPDTECLVERVIEYIKKTGADKALDIGTGSGAIAVSLAALTGIHCTGCDISQKALEMAAYNAKKNGVKNKTEFVLSDVFENIEGSFDIIVSNPPYIESDVIPTLSPQVKDYEPLRALDGGSDGLMFYRKIASEACNYLKNGGLIAFEIGYNQGGAVKEILEKFGFSEVFVCRDLAGLDRTVCGVLYKTEESYV